MNRLTFVAGLALSAHAAPRLGGCPKDYKPMETFDLARYTGKWYEIVRDKYTPFELFSSCVTAEYTANADDTITVHNSAYRLIFGTHDATATAVQSSSGDASLVVNFKGSVPDPTDKANYTVLDTDYDTYSVVYSCGEFMGLASFDFLWVLSREPTMDDETLLSIVEKIDAKLPDYGFFANHHMTHQGWLCPDREQTSEEL